jgi:sirohydrochlorin ferrochelatase
VVQQSGEALARVQAATAAAEKEDDARHALKDSVDARLLAWRGGKEANLRALLASLDTVLWDGAGVQKVGMHELVTPAQVKVKYTRAIARLHPDKVRTSPTFAYQR